MSSTRPKFSPAEAERTVSERYGITGSAVELVSYDDQNFRIDSGGAQYTLKISYQGETRGWLELETAVMAKLAGCSFEVPRALTSKDGERIITIPQGGQEFMARLLTFVPGRLLFDVSPQSLSLMHDLGRTMGEAAAALDGFTHPHMQQDYEWDLLKGQGFVTDQMLAMLDSDDARRVRELTKRLDSAFFMRLENLRKSVVHNDPNDYNVLVAESTAGQRISGVFDFGDTMQTLTIADVAITAAYAAMDKKRPLATIAAVTAGFHSEFALLEEELPVILDLVRLRLCMSACFAVRSRLDEPDNEYVSVHERRALELLRELEPISSSFAEAALRQACGFDPHPETTRAVAWLAENGCGNVVEADFKRDKLLVFDLSPGSLEMALPNSPHTFAEEDQGWGIGRYAEPRLIYQSDEFQGAGERRTIHIGMDVGGPAGTAALAPLDGVIVSQVDNDIKLDYGPTIILEHELPDGTKFATLYGHLSRESLAMHSPGDTVTRGEKIAEFGSEDVNGGWPPHLHFQILPSFFREMDGSGNFPGVVYASELEIWKSICPDPNVILGVPRELLADETRDKNTLLEERTDHLGPSLSISYDEPLKIVRGIGQHLYDENGHPYLDCVNNVCHVGHCHPKVVEAGQGQMAVLNTNTRYLHDNIVAYSEKLLATFPDDLEVVFLVCSGSEANELALRLARTYTGNKGIVVLDNAYHGNTSSLIDISPYKFNAAGGRGKPDHVHIAEMPDAYRVNKSAAQFADDVRAQCEGRRVAAFIAESMLGCGGQICLPDGYLEAGFTHARNARAVCIADEVQTGFGRAGSHFWAFQTQGVVPDIVTLGKPIGNGHPLGAVVTTRKIADAFANGMEYFNTFGGNPVSCAIGSAVLDVIQDEGLQDHALEVGEHLMAGLRALKDKHALIGDVRGSGLFIGVELVKDRASKEPAADEADYIINRLRGMEILMSTDGPMHNVLKIKPPMVFGAEDADRMIEALDEVLGDSCLDF